LRRDHSSTKSRRKVRKTISGGAKNLSGRTIVPTPVVA
jgi:hypothetical protein